MLELGKVHKRLNDMLKLSYFQGQNTDDSGAEHTSWLHLHQVRRWCSFSIQGYSLWSISAQQALHTGYQQEYQRNPGKRKTVKLQEPFPLIMLYVCENMALWVRYLLQWMSHTNEYILPSAFLLPITCICEACRSIVIIWSAPDTDNMLATNLAEIGARLCNENRSHQSHGVSELASMAHF